MADPIPYDVSYSFSGFQQTNPSSPLPAPALDNELANVETTLDSLVSGLMDVRRSDGSLHNQSVGPDQLSPALNLGFTNRGTWQAGEIYHSGDGVAYDDIFYSARVENTATDANRPNADPATWQLLFSVASIVVADGSIGIDKLDPPTAATLTGAAQKAQNLADLASLPAALQNLVSNIDPGIPFNDVDAAVGNRRVRLSAADGHFTVSSRTDDNSAGQDVFSLRRGVGTAWTGASIYADLTVERGDDGGSAGPSIRVTRNSTSPAADDRLGEVVWQGRDIGAGVQDYAAVVGLLVTATVGAEDGALLFETTRSGVRTQCGRFQPSGRLLLGGAAYAGNQPEIGLNLHGAAGTWAQTSADIVNSLWSVNNTVGDYFAAGFWRVGVLKGSIKVTSTGTQYNTTSDETLKNFTGTLDGAVAAAIIRRDPVRTFEWKDGGREAIGWGAQTSYKVSPDLAEPGEGQRPWMMDLSRRTPWLWAALSAALDHIDDLEKRLRKLEKPKHG